MQKSSALFLLLVAASAAISFGLSFYGYGGVSALSRTLALSGFVFFCVSLIIGPLSMMNPKEFALLVEPRRAIGIAAFVLVFAHFLVAFFVEYGADLSFLTSGPAPIAATASIIVLAILTALSNDFSVKRIPQWKTIQRFAYPAFLLAFYHFFYWATRSTPNMVEIDVMGLGVITIMMQVYGYYTVKKRQAAAKSYAPAQSAPAAPAAPAPEAVKP
jgi:DMSO/TMAO reductase YedYZ heme-binding membrane subunit